MPNGDQHELGPLLERSLAGESPARNALLEKLRPFLKALIRSWMGPDLAGRLLDSDVVQETLLDIHKNFPAFRGQSVPELLGWVRRIAYHAALDRKKRLVRERAVGQPVEDLAAPALLPLDRIEMAEEVVRLTAALEHLSPARREVVSARLFEGLPYSEISQRCGVSEGALRVLLKRALEQLRQILDRNT